MLQIVKTERGSADASPRIVSSLHDLVPQRVYYRVFQAAYT